MSDGSTIYPMRCFGWLNPHAKVASDMGYPNDRYVPILLKNFEFFNRAKPFAF